MSGQEVPLNGGSTGYTSQPIPVPKRDRFDRAEIVFEGVEHAGPSFEGRVFANNPSADEGTEPTAENGYVGSFHVFGFGNMAADTGEGAAGGARLPGSQSVAADPAALRSAIESAGELTLKVVPVPADPTPEGLPGPLVDRVSVVFD